MITLDRFKQLMNTEFIKNMLTVHKCDEIVVDINEEFHHFRINSQRDGKHHNYFIMYHIIRSENDELLISSITDRNYNNLIKWNGEKYELIPYQTNVPFGAIDALLYLMNLDMTDGCHMKEERVMPKIKAPAMKPKQKKKVYPNIFDHRIPGIAGIKDIQIHEKNSDTITTVIWSDKDEKGRNKVTVVACCATEHPNTETGIAMAIAKRYFGGRNVFKRITDEANILNNKRFQQSRHRASVKRKKKGEIDDSQ